MYIVHEQIYNSYRIQSLLKLTGLHPQSWRYLPPPPPVTSISIVHYQLLRCITCLFRIGWKINSSSSSILTKQVVLWPGHYGRLIFCGLKLPEIILTNKHMFAFWKIRNIYSNAEKCNYHIIKTNYNDSSFLVQRIS